MSAAPPPTRLLVVDDEEGFRHLLTAFLADQDDMEVVGRAVSGEDAVTQVGLVRPDLVLMDVQMPGMGGIEATRFIARCHPEVAVLVLTVMVDLETVVSSLRAGARGYLLKDTTPTALADHVRTAMSGGGALSPLVARALVDDLRHRPDPVQGDEGHPVAPSRAELEVLQLLAAGLGNAQIARRLHVSLSTVKLRLAALSQKWDVAGRAQVLMVATKAGYIS